MSTAHDPTSVSLHELQLAARNHALPLEALRYDLTPPGLHYVLVHYDIPVVDPATHRVAVGGAVDRPLELSLEELARLPAAEVVVTMECAGNGRALLAPRPVSQPWLLEAVGTARWSGVRLRDVLELAGVGDRAVEVLFTGLDRGIEGGVEQRFARSLTVDEALRDEVILATQMNGAPPPPQHGFPVRLVVPGWYGMTNVKWLAEITLLERPFDGYQQLSSYRMRMDPDEPGEPLSRIAPRALMAPPGIPDFLTRRRTVPREGCVLEGRAWSGSAPIASVEVSTDGGERWAPADLEPAASAWSWARWRLAWDEPEPGHHTIGCRATDETGAVQPSSPRWNVGGYVNNAVQWLEVEVGGAA